MIVEESFSIAAPREAVIAFLLEVERMSRCVPGVEDLRQVSGNRYEATLGVRLGPIHASFNGTVEVDDSQAPERLRATGSGRDSATGSVAQVEFIAELEESDGATLVKSRSDVAIRGRLGQFGTGVIGSTARVMVQEFAACAATQVSGGRSGQAAHAPSLSRVARRGLIGYLAGLWRRLLALGRGGEGGKSS